MQKILVAVSPEDIEAGKQWFSDVEGMINRSTVCPIALALTSVVTAPVNVSGNGGCYIGNHVLTLPLEARKFIIGFDDEGYAQPFSFELELPDEVELR